jgi:arylsulfatase A-like enzyme
MLTGLYPRAHGVHVNSVERLPASAVTLAEILGEAGYATAAAVATIVLDPAFGLAQGFQRYDAVPRTPQSGSDLWLAERPAREMVERALAIVETLPRPFFLWLHLFDPHFPYRPVPMPDVPPGVSGNERTRFLYGAEIHSMDTQLGRLFAGLEEAGVWDDLVVVVTSDHGESLGEHGETAHGFYVYDPTMRVPLLVRHPELPARRVADPVTVVDLVPTALSLLGLARPDLDFDGVDVSAAARGDALAGGDHRLRALESHLPWAKHGWAPFEGVVKGPWKLIYSRRRELYDRSQDPQEQSDRYRDDDPVASDLVRAWEALFEAPRAEPLDEAHVLTTLERDALASLGYAAGVAPLPTGRPDFASLQDPHEKRRLLQLEEQAVRLAVRGDGDRVIALFQELCREAPESAYFHEKLGAFLLAYRPQALDEARAALERAVQLHFPLARAHYNLGLIAARQGDRQRALECFLRALSVDPNYLGALVEAARAEFASGSEHLAEGRRAEARALYSSAREHLARALEVCPETLPEHEKIQRISERIRVRLAEIQP